MYAENVRCYIERLRCDYREMAQDDYYAMIEEWLEGTETPIEQLFAIAIYNEQENTMDTYEDYFEIYPQYEIEVCGHYFRVDFVLSMYYMIFDENGKPIHEITEDMIVECDGHSYHSTKDQIKKDNNRDRIMQFLGYDVIRFSGSELNESPEKCAKQAFLLLKQRTLEKVRMYQHVC